MGTVVEFMMKKILVIVALGLFYSGVAYAHEINGETHEPIRCILEQDRSYTEKQFCKLQAKQHRLCILDQHCAMIKIEELEKEIKKLKGQ